MPPGRTLGRSGVRLHSTGVSRVRYSERRDGGIPQGSVPDDGVMLEEEMSTAELLEQWREALRASELAARLAKIAAESVARTAKEADAAEELAKLAERAAAAATEAATTARRAADAAAELARTTVTDRTKDDEALVAAQAVEGDARDRYHEAEQTARGRHTGEAGG